MKNFFVAILILSPIIASAQYPTDFMHENSIVNSKGEKVNPDKDRYKQPVCPYSLEKFFRENVKYPEEGIKNNLEGKVFVLFIIDSTGKVINPRIVRGLGNGFDEEVMRVFQLMPDWEPGYSDGKPVNSRKVLPIDFKLPRKSKK